MGLTLIHKSKGRPRRAKPKIALVLAGGAVSGGAFKVGGIKALHDYLPERGLCGLDLYVGLSAGAVLAIPLAGGVQPEEMIRVLEGQSEQLDPLRPIDLYRPNLQEFAARPASFAYQLCRYLPGISMEVVRGLASLPDSVGSSFRAFTREPSYTRFESFFTRFIEHTAPSRPPPSPTDFIPSGLFDNRPLEQWMRRNLERVGIPNDFRAFERKQGVSLYLSACELDTAERVVFGADEKNEVTISQAMQASSALPFFYKPARINGVDYVDGGVRNTANIDVAIEKGADLIICYNPFRPFLNRTDPERYDPSEFREGQHLADRGMKMVMNQVFRTLLHSRLRLGLQRYLGDSQFHGDIVLIEPREEEADFFALNPLAFGKRSEAIRQGFDSVRNSIETNFRSISEIVRPYGLRMDRKRARARAREIYEQQGWGAAKPKSAETDDRNLRLVGS